MQIGRHPLDATSGKCAAGAPCSLGEAARRMNDQLGQQGVVIGRRRTAVKAMGVHPDARATGQVKARHGTPRRSGVSVGACGLGVDPPLDRATLHGRRIGGIKAQIPQSQAGRNADLELNQIEAGDRLRDRVLDLQAGIGLDEGKRQINRLHVDQEFEGAQPLVADGTRHAQRRVGELGPQSR